MVDFTVAIPTYNGADRLPKVLECLRSQKETENFQWEVLVVDNNSHDETANVVRQYQESWPSQTPLKYCFEGKQGLAHARQCAIDNARGELIGFVDDDVLPAQDWVSSAYGFSLKHPEIGAYGGQIHPAFESSPPENFKRIQSFLAIRERGDNPHRYRPELLNMPPGAALVVRKRAWQTSVPKELRLIGRVNGTMLSGEDFEALLHMHHQGWEIWYNPTMHSHHQLPAHRLDKPYLLKLAQGCGLCVCYLRLMHSHPLSKPIIVIKIILGGLKRTIQHWWKYRHQIPTDPVLACEFKFFMSTWLSPLFWLSQIFQRRKAQSVDA